MSLFNIFNDRLSKQSTRTVPRQLHSNNENIGKGIAIGPTKLNEPVQPFKKAGDKKKSFLSNTGKALDINIQTPVQKPLSPRSKNVQCSARKMLCTPVIYSDEMDEEARTFYEELEFTKPSYRYDNYSHKDLFDYLLENDPRIAKSPTPSTPPPISVNRSLEFDCSYEDEFFRDDFTTDPSPFGEDDLPELFID